MRLIGLNARARAGKDTAFEVIFRAARAHDKKAQRVAFADKLKLSAARSVGFDPKDAAEAVAICNKIKEGGHVNTVYYDPEKLNPRGASITGREFLQRYGTESHRDVFGDDFWIDALLPRPSGASVDGEDERALRVRFPDTDVVVVTDIRFENEARRIRGLGGEVWYIDADARLGELPAYAHVSERPLPERLIDRTLYNNCDLLTFQKAVVEAYQA